MKEVIVAILLGISLLGVLSVIVFGTNTCGRYVDTVAQRKINENSFQYQEARKSELLRFESDLRSINSKLMDASLSEQKRRMLESQKQNIQTEIDVIKGKIK